MPTLSPIKTTTTVSTVVLSPVKTTLKQTFVDALRSGKYQQCQNVMTTKEGAYCAMGVFHAINGDPEINDISISMKFHPAVFNKIAGLNDQGVSFSVIANILDSGLSDDLQSLTT